MLSESGIPLFLSRDKAGRVKITVRIQKIALRIPAVSVILLIVKIKKIALNNSGFRFLTDGRSDVLIRALR